MVYSEQKAIRDGFGVELGQATVEGIIAAKLEPVREALKAVRVAMQPALADGLLDDVLATLSEEE